MVIYKKSAWLTLFLYTLTLFIPLFETTAAEDSSPENSKKEYRWFSDMGNRVTRNFSSKAANLTPDQVQEIIDSSQTETFEGNPTLRVEQSTIMRPIKQIGLRVLDGEIGIVQTFLGFESAKFLKESLLGKMKKPEAVKSLQTARQVVNSMSPKQLQSVNQSLDKLQISSKIRQAIQKTAPGVKTFMKSEANFFLMTVIGTMVSMGIYDGLDVTTMKDKILALDPLQYNNTVSHSLLPNYMGAMASRHFYSFFNARFDMVYDRILKSKSFFGYMLNKLDVKADTLGKKIFKATRMGINVNQSESLAKKLGLVGVGEGTQFTLKGFLKSVGSGLAYGLVAQLAVDSIIVGARGYNDTAVIGGNRNKITVRPQYNSLTYQRSESKIKNWLTERKFALNDMWDSWRKQPLTKVVSAVTGFTGAYLGSVVAGAVLVSGGLPAMVGGVMIASLFGGIGSFIGSWGTTKFERSDMMKNLRRSLVEKRLFKAIQTFTSFLAGKIDLEQARSIAKERSHDFYKRESLGQPYHRMYLVEDLENIELYKNGEYVQMKVEKGKGEPFDMEAHIRYDFVDLDGYRGLWDIGENKIYNIGRIKDNNGFIVIFISDNDKVQLSGQQLISEKGDEFRVLSNGLIMTPSDLDREKWVIRGQNVNTDVFLRNRQVRYTWDYDQKAYIALKAVDSGSSLLEKFQAFIQKEKGFKDLLLTRVEGELAAQTDSTRAYVEAIDLDTEADFFLSLEQAGVSRDVVHGFLDMEASQWKGTIVAKLDRSMKRELVKVLGQLQGTEEAELKSSLLKEIENSEANTVWDQVNPFLNRASILKAVLTN